MMTIKKDPLWVTYSSDNTVSSANTDECGKWMYYWDNKEGVADICKKAISENIVQTCKHKDKEYDGVACFYLDLRDIEGHKKVLSFFMRNDMIQKTKTGRLYNISFKLDEQTKNHEYKKTHFKAKISLSDFVDLDTGEFLSEISLA